MGISRVTTWVIGIPVYLVCHLTLQVGLAVTTGLHACQLTHDISRPDFERCCTGFYNRLPTSVQEVSVWTRRYLQILEAFIWAAN